MRAWVRSMSPTTSHPVTDRLNPAGYLSVDKDNQPVISLHVQPNAAKNRVVGLHDGCLKLAVASPPVDGKANKAVLRFLSDLLGVSPRQLMITHGLQSRRKQIVVLALTQEEVRTRLTSVMPG
jgi:uncharacterized protein (TIGR00251 family)